MTDDLRETIRAKLGAALLRSDTPSRVWYGNGADYACVACGRRVRTIDRECEADFADGATLRFHRDCFYVWEEERRAAREERQPEEACVIAAAILSQPVCVPCLVEKTGIPVSRVRGFLARIPATVELTVTVGPCAECQRETTTYRIA